MTLPFQQTWPERMGELAGQPNYFVEKIILGLEDYSLINESYPVIKAYSERTGKDFISICNTMYESNLEPKIHTIREDKADRWKAGNDIHFVINSRTKNRFQFAPVVLCVSVQEIEIKHIPFGKNGNRFSQIYVDGNAINQEGEKIIALNDGFPSVEAFFQYFKEDFIGKIIHWTDLKY